MLNKPSPRLPLDSVEELFDKLKWEETRLVDSWGVYDSWNFLLTAHHLYHDWFGGKKLSPATDEQKGRRLLIENTLPSIKKLFHAISDVANGNKHFDLDSAKKKQIVHEATEPEISDYDSYFYGEMIYISFDDYRVSMFAGSEMVIRCLDWIIYGGDQTVLDEVSSALVEMKGTLTP